MKPPACGSNNCKGRSLGAPTGPLRTLTLTPTTQDACSAAIAAQDRLPLCDLILAILLRSNRSCSPHEIMEVIAGAGFEVPDRQHLTQAIEVELVAAARPLATALFELQGSRDNHWGLSAVFTGWLMSTRLPSLRNGMSDCPIEAANDG